MINFVPPSKSEPPKEPARTVTAQVPGSPLDPPDDLTPEQKMEWYRVTAEVPATWFTAENGPLLAQLCRHICNARFIAGLIEVAKGLPPDQFEWAPLQEMFQALRAESGAIVQLSTKLRLTNQSRYVERRTPGNERKKVGAGPKPWNDWRDRPRDTTTQ
jgi:hypothetical protein